MNKQEPDSQAIVNQNTDDLIDLIGMKPWLDPNGKRIPAPLLKIFARDWNVETWDLYLESFEKPAKEKYVSTKHWADLVAKTTENIFDYSQSPASDDLHQEVDSSVKVLPSFHRQVVRMTYWHNMSVRAIAKALGLPKSTVYDMITGAQRTLRVLLKIELGHFALNEGTIHNFKKERENDQDISA